MKTKTDHLSRCFVWTITYYIKIRILIEHQPSKSILTLLDIFILQNRPSSVLKCLLFLAVLLFSFLIEDFFYSHSCYYFTLDYNFSNVPVILWLQFKRYTVPKNCTETQGSSPSGTGNHCRCFCYSAGFLFFYFGSLPSKDF